MRVCVSAACTGILLSLVFTSCAGNSRGKQPKFTESIKALSFYRGALVRTPADRSWYARNDYNFLVGPEALKGEKTSAPLLQIPVRSDALCDGEGSRPIRLLPHPNRAGGKGVVEPFDHFEIASGDPLDLERGDSSRPSAEELWDEYQTKTHRVFATGADALPTNGSATDRVWLQAWAPGLSAGELCRALRLGHFYVSRGSRLAALVVTDRSLELSVDNWQPSTDHVDFVGAGGQLLDRVVASPARYVLRGGEGYVRAHIFQDRLDGSDRPRKEAWTQAYFIKYE